MEKTIEERVDRLQERITLDEDELEELERDVALLFKAHGLGIHDHRTGPQCPNCKSVNTRWLATQAGHLIICNDCGKTFHLGEPPSEPDNKVERAPGNEPDIERLAEVAHGGYHDGKGVDWEFPWKGESQRVKDAWEDTVRAILKELGYQGEGAASRFVPVINPTRKMEERESAFPGPFAFLYDFCLELMKRYEQHQPKKGDSWKEMTGLELVALLIDEWKEIEEVLSKISNQDTPMSEIRKEWASELIDIALVAAMCWAREKDQHEEDVTRLAEKLPDNFALDPAAHR